MITNTAPISVSRPCAARHTWNGSSEPSTKPAPQLPSSPSSSSSPHPFSHVRFLGSSRSSMASYRVLGNASGAAAATATLLSFPAVDRRRPLASETVAADPRWLPDAADRTLRCWAPSFTVSFRESLFARQRRVLAADEPNPTVRRSAAFSSWIFRPSTPLLDNLLLASKSPLGALREAAVARDVAVPLPWLLCFTVAGTGRVLTILGGTA